MSYGVHYGTIPILYNTKACSASVAISLGPKVSPLQASRLFSFHLSGRKENQIRNNREDSEEKASAGRIPAGHYPIGIAGIGWNFLLECDRVELLLAVYASNI